MQFANKSFSAFRDRIDQAIEDVKQVGLKPLFASYIQLLSRKQKALILVLLVLFSSVILLSPVPKDVRPVNVHARSVSVAWILPRASWGCALLLPTSLNTLPRIGCEGSIAAVHLQELTNLKPETSYRIVLISGLMPAIWTSPHVTTTAIREEMPDMPKPAYGSVLFDQEKVAGALVLVYANTSQPQYAVAALTNAQGNFAVDLANVSEAGNSYVLDAFASDHRSARLEADIRLSTPFPPLLLHDQIVSWWENLWLRLKGAR